jgi:hypothetical protein
VKHFKFEPRGKRRLHKRPNAYEIERCRWWLVQERTIVNPEIIVALGATAARSLLGRVIKIAKVRGKFMTAEAGTILVTNHPSYLLRIQDEHQKAEAYQGFVEDLSRVHAPSPHEGSPTASGLPKASSPRLGLIGASPAIAAVWSTFVAKMFVDGRRIIARFKSCFGPALGQVGPLGGFHVARTRSVSCVWLSRRWVLLGRCDHGEPRGVRPPQCQALQ